jgi:hypothetical protein
VIEAYMGSMAKPNCRVPMHGGTAGAICASRDLHAWYGESHILHGVDST